VAGYAIYSTRTYYRHTCITFAGYDLNMHTAHTLEIDTDASHVWQDMYLYITYVYYSYIPYVAHDLWHTHLR